MIFFKFTVITVIKYIYNIMAWSVVSFKFYEWFIWPEFSNLMFLTLKHFFGITIFLSSLLYRETPEIIEEYRSIPKEIMVFIFFPWVNLLFGYIFYLIFH